MKTKYCFGCKETKQTNEFFINRNTKDGLNYICRKCAAMRRQRPEQIKYRAIYDHERHKTKKWKDYSLAYKKLHPKILTPEEKELQRAYFREWWKSPKGRATNILKFHKRRSIERNLICDLTVEQWEEIKAIQDYRCAICGEIKPLERDHIVPLSKGGAFVKENV